MLPRSTFVRVRPCKVGEIVCSILCARTSAPPAALYTRIIVLYDSFITRRYTARLLHIYRQTPTGFFLSRRAPQRTLRARRRSITPAASVCENEKYEIAQTYKTRSFNIRREIRSMINKLDTQAPTERAHGKIPPDSKS